jgi:hypothetical protein
MLDSMMMMAIDVGLDDDDDTRIHSSDRFRSSECGEENGAGFGGQGE